MLLDVLQGTEAGGLIIIQDTACYSGRRLLKYYINGAIQREEAVHVLAFEVSEQDLCSRLDPKYKHLLHYHNASKDPLGWNEQSSFTVQHFNTPDIKRLIHKQQDNKASVLVIDSLSWVIRHHDLVTVCQELHKLRREGSVRLIFTLLHSDLHQQAVVQTVCHLASAVISVTPQNKASYAVAKTTRRKKSGKVTQEEVSFNVSEDLMLSLDEKHSQTTHVQSDSMSQKVDPTSNLTFNLRLSEAEKEAKDKVALPFVFSEEKKSALLGPAQGSGRIMYEPDANDDFDDEDPDDDLDV